MSSRRQMLEFLSLTRLPNTFQEVEYIESSGTQYIDTGIATNSQKIQAHLYRVGNNAGTYLGSYESDNVFRVLFYENKNQFQLRRNTLFDTNDTSNDITLLIDLPNISLNSFTDNTTINEIINQYNIFLFCGNINGTASSFQSMKLYSCQIYDNNTLVRNFVPCYRKADSEIGLYDLVNGVFYTNAGTGTFTKGANV